MSEEEKQKTKGEISQKDMYYLLKDVAQGFEDLHTRLDNLEEKLEKSGEVTAAEGPQPPRHYNIQERAQWESTNSGLLRMTSQAVSATKTRGELQSHMLGVLDWIGNLGDLANEKFLAFAGLLEEHQLLMLLRHQKKWYDSIAKIAPWIVLAVIVFVAGEGIFQPQNFQTIVSGLSDPRNLLIVMVVIGVFAAIFLYSWIRSRRQPKGRTGVVR